MKAVVIAKSADYLVSVKDCIANAYGTSNLVADVANHKLFFDFSTHNAVEGLREKLMTLGSVIEIIYL